jgi:hypothetical protein
MSESEVELFGQVLLYLETIAVDAEASCSEDMAEVADYVRGVLVSVE